jgi:hypothetical protein
MIEAPHLVPPHLRVLREGGRPDDAEHQLDTVLSLGPKAWLSIADARDPGAVEQAAPGPVIGLRRRNLRIVRRVDFLADGKAGIHIALAGARAADEAAPVRMADPGQEFRAGRR